jgi:hypothetical protein
MKKFSFKKYQKGGKTYSAQDISKTLLSAGYKQANIDWVNRNPQKARELLKGCILEY